MTQARQLPLPDGPSPVELAALLPPERHPLLLDSGVGAGGRTADGGAESARAEGGDLARWNLLLFDPLEVVTARARPGGRAFASVEAALARHFPRAERPAPEPAEDAAPAFRGGAAGYLGYDLGRELERLPELARPDADLPDLCVGIYPFALAQPAAGGPRRLVGRGTEGQARAARRAVEDLDAEFGRRLRAGRPQPVPGPGMGGAAPSVRVPASSFDREGYLAAVRRVREHILDGEIYQVNLCQRFELPWSGDPARLQRRIAARFPAAFGALFRAPGLAVVSSSPELFLRRRGTAVESRPIKGTRPRGADPADDAALRAELEASAKERAELAMIVDLVRNDLGRTARIGSVRVDGPFRTEAYPTVFHRVARVRATVDPDCPTVAVVAAAFPPASVTGTPKVAAQAVIESLEPVRRHVYTGAIGWIGADGDCDLSVAIRIATATGGRLLLPFGGGLTLASDPAAEYDETLHKARAWFEVLGLALPGTGCGAPHAR